MTSSAARTDHSKSQLRLGALSASPEVFTKWKLAPPTVTASGLAFVIPTIGEEVLYQRLLIPAGERPSLAIEARRKPKRR